MSRYGIAAVESNSAGGGRIANSIARACVWGSRSVGSNVHFRWQRAAARLLRHLLSGTDARVAVRGQAGGREHEPARRRTKTSGGDGGSYQLTRWSNSKAGADWSSGSAAGSCSASAPPTAAGRGWVRSLLYLTDNQSQKVEVSRYRTSSAVRYDCSRISGL